MKSNRIEHVHPRQVKASIYKYRTGGAVETESVNEVIEEIQDSLRMDLPPDIKRNLEKQLKDLESKRPPIIDDEEVEDQEVYSASILSQSKYFEINDQNIIGSIKEDTDRYGKQIKVVEGTIADIEDQIRVSDDFAQFVKQRDYAVSYTNDSVEDQLEDPENDTFIEEVISTSKETVKRKKEQPEVEIDKDQIQTTAETYKKLNPKISQEDLRAYLWYKDQQGQRLSDEWYKIAGYKGYVQSTDSTLLQWVKNGQLYYYKGDLLPDPIYLSGDMYEKISRIVKVGRNSGQDIDYIKENYGEDVLQKQLERCNQRYEEVYTDRLILTGNKDGNSLILKPIDKIAKTYMVTELKDYDTFKWYTTNDKPNWEKTTGRSQSTFDELSLFDAFCFYLVTEGRKLDIKGGVTYLDIIQLYLFNKSRKTPSGVEDKEKWKIMYKRSKAKAKEQGDILFLKFLNQQLLNNDKVALETTWNRNYNNYLEPDYEKIPVGFNVTREFFGEDPFIIKPEKREAVSFMLNEGAGCLAYDVGVGKTMCAIMIAEQFIVAGYCERPVIIVPAQTYKQWISEIKNVLPHRKVNDYMNLRQEFLDKASVKNKEGEEVAVEVDSGSITVLTYEGFQMLSFNEQTQEQLLGELESILRQQDFDYTKGKKVASFREKLEGIVGKGLKGSFLNIEDFNFDFICYDEAHALKKVFTNVNAEVTQDGKQKSRKQYQFSSGEPSKIALKGFMMSQYVLKNNNNRNILMLTATPFTNSPLEVYSMLSLVGYGYLKQMGLNNLHDFFTNYIEVSDELTINHKYQPEYKQVVKSFNNLPSLQKIIRRYFNYKTGEDVGVVRPNKYVLPYTKKLIDNRITKLPEEEQVLTYLTPTDVQQDYMNDIIAFAEKKISESDLRSGNTDIDFEENEDIEETDETPSEVVELKDLDTESRQKATAIISMNLMRNVSLSPYLYEYNQLGEPDYKSFVELSPKILYTVKCIETVKNYHEDNNQPVSGQVIYMDRGIKYFPLIKKYLVDEIGFEDHEVGFINGSMKIEDRKNVQDAFLGRGFDEKEQDFVKITDDERIKVLIGSSSIREGMNLQKKSTCLYNLFIDFNPTDNLQLAGRVWRQGNKYKNVRIVNPLLIDSSDVFMFQKLEEKTARINTIWSNNGKSALNLDEFNPEELKNSLIKDPYVLAEIRNKDSLMKIKDDIQFKKGLIERLKEFLSAKQVFENSRSFLENQYFDFDRSGKQPPKDPIEILKAINKLNKRKVLKDAEGRQMISWLDKQPMSWDEKREKNISSEHRPTMGSYQYGSLKINLRLIKKELRDLLEPRGIEPTETGVNKAIDQIQTEIEQLEDREELLESDNYKETVVQEIIEDRKKNKIKDKPLLQLVQDFEKLNYLLNFKYCNISTKPKQTLKEQVIEGLKDLKALLEITEGSLKEEIKQGIKDLEEIKKFA